MHSRNRVLESILALPDQCIHGWEEAAKLRLPAAYKRVRQVLISGMGGSGLGARFIAAACGRLLKVPLRVVDDYVLPPGTGHDTLLFISSYSGETEETLTTLTDGARRGARMITATTGGTLAREAKKYRMPLVQFHPRFNPAGAPRFAVGYSIGVLLGVLSKTGLVSLREDDARGAFFSMRETLRQLHQRHARKQNPAHALAKMINGRAVIIVAAEHLLGAAHIFQNQLHETAKNFACAFPLPELNHHLMEGLQFPRTNTKTLACVVFGSPSYSPRMNERLTLTEAVLTRQHIPTYRYDCRAVGPLEQALECVAFTSTVAYFVAGLHRVDPLQNPWVDYFKKRLSKRP